MRVSIKELICRHPKLEMVTDELLSAEELLIQTFESGGKLLIAGNGGSAADAEHIVGELMKSFVAKRSISEEYADKLRLVDKELGSELAEKLQGALPAIALVDHVALSTAYLNDVEPLLGFAQQVNGYGVCGDIFLAISTSGNSKNILYACVTAKAKGMKVIGLTGRDGGALKQLCDVCIVVPEEETYKIQELHLPVYHWLCLAVEEHFWSRGC